MNKKLRRIDDERLNILEKDWLDFKNIYSQNGKELAQLGVIIKSLIEKFNEHSIDQNNWKINLEKKLFPLVDGYKAIHWIFYFLVGIGSLILLIKQIFYK